MQKEIIAAIAAYLEKNTDHIWHTQGERMAFKKPCEYPVFSEKKFCQFIAAEIAAAIAPLMESVEPDWNDAPEWANFRTVDKNREVTFWEKEPYSDLNREFWMERSIDGKFQTRKYNDNWANSMQKRPA